MAEGFSSKLLCKTPSKCSESEVLVLLYTACSSAHKNLTSHEQAAVGLHCPTMIISLLIRVPAADQYFTSCGPHQDLLDNAVKYLPRSSDCLFRLSRANSCREKLHKEPRQNLDLELGQKACYLTSGSKRWKPESSCLYVWPACSRYKTAAPVCCVLSKVACLPKRPAGARASRPCLQG